jgi:aerobic-type carbon monoxide dehydrogenase small subunit (CoxS/CutS family)/ABC-type nitrate/sulfonate/bicarbonate transport system substrate-binding protein
MTTLLRLGMFSPSVLLEVARVTGALRSAGLAVDEVPATSSTAQFAELLAGDLDAALTSPDNVLAYRFVATNPLGRIADVRVLAAVDRGLGLSLFAAPDRAPTGLRGGTLAVDVPGSGFAFVAVELLARHGLRAGDDCPVEALGATPRRAEALLAGRCAVTVLNAGSDLRAEAAGALRLARATAIGPYLGTVLAAHGPALESDGGALAALTTVLTGTAARIVAGELHDVARATAVRRLRLDDESAARYVATLTDPGEGLVPGGLVDRAALGTLVELRNRHGSGPPLDVDAVLAGGFVDDRFLPVGFRVNGRPVTTPAEPGTPLLYVLRGDLGLLGTRFGCGSGDCGACLVLVDGHPVPSCDTPVGSVAGKDVITVEGLAAGGSHPLQEEFLAGQAAQCGYCVSGILVNAAALLAARPRPTEAAVRAHLDRNLCRCGAHNRMVRAVLRAAERMERS